MTCRIIALFFLGVASIGFNVGHAFADTQEILILNVADPIGPGVAEFMVDGLKQASDSQAACIIITLDTPGGLVESMRKIVQAMYACEVPVVVYVTPAGARAASAGVMITMAADIAVMTPGTHIGAAHPVGAGGQDIGKTMAEKAVNDLVAFAKGVANQRGRNAEWAEKAVRESVSVTAAEALKSNVIDLLAKDLDELIAAINGREIQGKGVLQLDNYYRIQIKEGLRTKILKTISDPNIAYILLMIGLAGLYFELAHPGVVFPGVVGGIALILAFFSLQTLPVNTAGILLILLGIIFFILELKIVSYGMLSLAGLVSFVLGSLMLFKGAGSEYQIALDVLLPTVLLVSAFFTGVVLVVIRAYAHKPLTGLAGLVNEIGVIKQINGWQAKVSVHGEVWQADIQKRFSVGDKVRIVSVKNLVVTVAPLTEDNHQKQEE